MQRINRPEFAGGLSFFQHFRDPPEERAEIFLHDSLQMVCPAMADAHHLALHDPRVERMARNIIEVCAGVGENFFPGGKVERKNLSQMLD